METIPSASLGAAASATPALYRRARRCRTPYAETLMAPTAITDEVAKI
ncbi:MAG: hypothetical protein JSV90_05245 [Methanobacteriota archaeon]|nr:MAG: hypothetical protein JSV90_05245 [Euryarchaeota archaeon]